MSTLTEWKTAARIAEKEICHEVGDVYAKVVQRCIFCRFSEGSHSLVDAVFQRLVYRGVVSELQKALDEFSQTSSIGF